MTMCAILLPLILYMLLNINSICYTGLLAHAVMFTERIAGTSKLDITAYVVT